MLFILSDISTISTVARLAGGRRGQREVWKPPHNDMLPDVRSWSLLRAQLLLINRGPSCGNNSSITVDRSHSLDNILSHSGCVSSSLISWMKWNDENDCFHKHHHFLDTEQKTEKKKSTLTSAKRHFLHFPLPVWEAVYNMFTVCAGVSSPRQHAYKHQQL